jgi:hypothetical protein
MNDILLKLNCSYQLFCDGLTPGVLRSIECFDAVDYPLG